MADTREVIDALATTAYHLVAVVEDPEDRLRLITQFVQFQYTLAVGLGGETDTPKDEWMANTIRYTIDYVENVRRQADLDNKAANAHKN